MKITPQYYKIPHTVVYVEIFEHLIEDMCNCSIISNSIYMLHVVFIV